MPISVTESKQLIRAFLLENAAVNAVVKGQIYGAHLSTPDAQTALQKTPMVVFDLAGGEGKYFRSAQALTIDVYVWSKNSADEADQVYDLVYAALQECRMTVSGLLTTGVAMETQRPITGWSPELGAWYSRARWTANMIAGTV